MPSGGGLGLLAELDHHEGHGGVDADERDDEEDETDDHLAHALLGFLGVLVHLRGAHELLGIYGPVAVGVENLERGLDLGGEGRDGHGTLVVGLAQHRVGADHRLEFVHVEDAVAVRVEVFEHALNVRGEGADVDPPRAGQKVSVGIGGRREAEHRARSRSAHALTILTSIPSTKSASCAIFTNARRLGLRGARGPESRPTHYQGQTP